MFAFSTLSALLFECLIIWRLGLSDWNRFISKEDGNWEHYEHHTKMKMQTTLRQTINYSVIHCKYINLSDCQGLFKYIPTLNWMGVISAPSCKKNVDDFLMNKVIDNMLYVALELIFISGKPTFNNKYVI